MRLDELITRGRRDCVHVDCDNVDCVHIDCVNVDCVHVDCVHVDCVNVDCVQVDRVRLQVPQQPGDDGQPGGGERGSLQAAEHLLPALRSAQPQLPVHVGLDGF